MSVISRIVDNKRKLLHLFCLEIVISGTARRKFVKLDDVLCAWIVCTFYKQFLRGLFKYLCRFSRAPSLLKVA